MPRPISLLALLFGALSSSCKGCGEDSAAGPDASAAPSVPEHDAGRIGALAWKAATSARGYGVPGGCRPRLPVRRAVLPEGDARFLSARGSAEDLVVARGNAESKLVTHRGIVSLGQGAWRDVPWRELESPPSMDRSDAGWLAALTAAREGSGAEAIVWREGRGATPTGVVGDQLTVADLACDRAHCAVLTTLARPTIAPGATVLFGRSNEPPSRWRRTDIEPSPDAAWRPSAIVSIDGSNGGVVVALESSGEAALWRTDAGGAKRLGRTPAPHGVLEHVATAPPVVVTPGRPLDDCRTDRFPLSIRPTDGGNAFDLDAHAAPLSAIGRPLTDGALLAWVAPVSCRMRDRTVLYAVLLDRGGRPASSVMSVADAEGFALAARGDRVDLWLLQGSAIAWVQADCSASALRDGGSARPKP